MKLGNSVKDLLYLCVHKSISHNGMGTYDIITYSVTQSAAVTLNSQIRIITRDQLYASVWDSIEDKLWTLVNK